MKLVYIIDFSNFAYKFKSVYKYSRVSVNGVSIDTSILTGFIRCLKANISNDILIVLDGVPLQSLSVLPGYKGQRQHDQTPSGLSVSKLEVVQFLTKVGELIGKNIKVVCSPGQETDEVISSIVHHVTGHLPARAEFISKLNTRKLSSDNMLKYLDSGVITTKYIPNYQGVIIASTDGDFIQLQRWQGVAIDTSNSNKRVSRETTSKSTSGLSPVASIVYKAIYGDISDNIPAIKVPYKKDEVLHSLNNHIKTDEDLLRFYTACTGGSDKSSPLSILESYIHKNCLKQFQVNWTVAFLTFRSYPLELWYPDYNIQDTIRKYKLKI